MPRVVPRRAATAVALLILVVGAGTAGYLAHEGDATRDEILRAAGIERARGLISQGERASSIRHKWRIRIVLAARYERTTWPKSCV